MTTKTPLEVALNSIMTPLYPPPDPNLTLEQRVKRLEEWQQRLTYNLLKVILLIETALLVAAVTLLVT